MPTPPKPKPAKKPRKPSLTPSQRFLAIWRSWNAGPDPETEVRFHPVRRWRLDYAWPELKLGVEIQGGTFMRSKSGHTSGAGLHQDHEKLNTAAAMGWIVIQVGDKYLTEANRDALFELMMASAALQQLRLERENVFLGKQGNPVSLDLSEVAAEPKLTNNRRSEPQHPGSGIPGRVHHCGIVVRQHQRFVSLNRKVVKGRGGLGRLYPCHILSAEFYG